MSSFIRACELQSFPITLFREEGIRMMLENMWLGGMVKGCGKVGGKVRRQEARGRDRWKRRNRGR